MKLKASSPASYTHKIFLGFAILVYLFTAYNSHGFHHPDEHFQVLEFAGLKIGFNTESDLAWEYHAQIRPSAQPYLAQFLIRSAEFLHIDSPYNQARFIRMLTALFILFCLYFFTETVKAEIDNKLHPYLYLLTYFLFFMPYMSVRFSSETMSTGFFLLGLSFILKNGTTDKYLRLAPFLISGIFIGLSYLFRFQSAFLIIGLFIWLLLIKKTRFDYLLYHASIIIIVIGLGSISDYFFYGNWNFTSWNYFESNILHNKAATFGTAPWYFYIIQLGDFKLLSVLILVLFSLFVFAWIFNAKSFHFFILLPFLFVHFIIAHKELRFLYPVFFFVPFICIEGYQSIHKFIKTKNIPHVLTVTFSFLAILNVVALGVFAIKPANAEALIYRFMEENYPNEKIYYLQAEQPDADAPSRLNMNFYIRATKGIAPVTPKELKLLNDGAHVMINDFYPVADLPLKEEFRVIPAWMRKLNYHERMYINGANWVIYRKTN